MTETRQSLIPPSPAPHRDVPARSGKDAYATTAADLAEALAGVVSGDGIETKVSSVRARAGTRSVRPREGGDPEQLACVRGALDSRLRGNERTMDGTHRSGRPEAKPEPPAHDEVPGLGVAAPGTTGIGSAASGIAAALRSNAARIRDLGAINADEWPALYHAANDVLNAAEFMRMSSLRRVAGA